MAARSEVRAIAAALAVACGACTGIDVEGQTFTCTDDASCGPGWRCNIAAGAQEGLCVEEDPGAPGGPDAVGPDVPGALPDAVLAGDAGGGDTPGPVPDAGPAADGPAPIVDGGDASGDGGADAAAGDATPDATPDAAPDAGPDAGPDVPCPTGCDDGNPCTADACADGVCANTPLDGEPCDDGDACSAGDTCQGGACTATPLPGCCKGDAGCDDDNPCTTDACDVPTGTCSHAPADGPCDADGDGCTAGDTCADGHCKPGPPVQCAASPLPCTKAVCVSTGAASHACEPAPVDEETPCDDGDPCTGYDACDDSGTCVPGDPVPDCCHDAPECSDGNPCTKDACDAASGACVHVAVADGLVCDADGDGCTAPDQCAGGTCVPGDPVSCPKPPSPCQLSSCTSTGPTTHGCKVTPAPKDTACEDGSACTLGDACDAEGTCKPGPSADECCQTAGDCSDGNPCTLDSCNVATGECEHANVENGTGCDADGDGCTAGDACVAGTCVAGTPVSCPAPANPCLASACVSDGPGASHCATGPAASGADCDDGQACTAGDACDGGGSCVGAPVPDCCTAAADCDEGNPCTADWCNEATGQCSSEPVEDGLPCDADGTGCTVADACEGGACVPGPPADCAELAGPCVGPVCTPDGPDAYTCSADPLPDLTPCNADADPCTVGDACKDGVCEAGPQADCSEGCGPGTCVPVGEDDWKCEKDCQ